MESVGVVSAWQGIGLHSLVLAGRQVCGERERERKKEIRREARAQRCQLVFDESGITFHFKFCFLLLLIFLTFLPSSLHYKVFNLVVHPFLLPLICLLSCWVA